jgi:hypothetical protein
LKNTPTQPPANTTEHPLQNNPRRKSGGAQPGTDSNHRRNPTKRKHTTAVTNAADGTYDPNYINEEEKREGQWSIAEITKGGSRTCQ